METFVTEKTDVMWAAGYWGTIAKAWSFEFKWFAAWYVNTTSNKWTEDVVDKVAWGVVSNIKVINVYEREKFKSTTTFVLNYSNKVSDAVKWDWWHTWMMLSSANEYKIAENSKINLSADFGYGMKDFNIDSDFFTTNANLLYTQTVNDDLKIFAWGGYSFESNSLGEITNTYNATLWVDYNNFIISLSWSYLNNNVYSWIQNTVTPISVKASMPINASKRKRWPRDF